MVGNSLVLANVNCTTLCFLKQKPLHVEQVNKHNETVPFEGKNVLTFSFEIVALREARAALQQRRQLRKVFF